MTMKKSDKKAYIHTLLKIEYRNAPKQIRNPATGAMYTIRSCSSKNTKTKKVLLMKVTDQSCLIQSSHPELICSSTFWEHPYAEEIYIKVLRALPYFPEITFPLRLNRHGTRGSYNAIAYVNFKSEPGVNFNIHFRSSMNTIFS